MGMKPKHDYAALDAAILARIAELRLDASFDAIHDAEVAFEADKLSTNERVKPNWKFVRERLQALRKAGKIKYRSSAVAWAIVKAPAS